MNIKQLQPGQRIKTDVFNSIITILKIEQRKKQNETEDIVHISVQNIEYDKEQIYEIGHIPILYKNLKDNIIEVLENNVKLNLSNNEGYHIWLDTDEKDRGVWNIDLKNIIDYTLSLSE